MAYSGDDATLIKTAVFCLALSVICTLGIQIMFVEASGDYDYDDIQAYRNQLISFSGDSMINQSPWVLTHVYTPWDPSLDANTHYDDGWLFGEDVAYEDVGKSADIHMDPERKSNMPITFTEEAASFDQVTGSKWWAGIPVINWLGDNLGFDPYTHTDIIANNWNYTGYRYVMDPTLPFDAGTVGTRDGSLSLVWYNYNYQEGISGGLDIYGGEVKLASYSAYDIIADYNVSSSYATVYDFDFSGTHLNLHIRFDPTVIESGTPLMSAWSQGAWTFAVSSISAGNFLDVEGSNAYSVTVGGLADTFIKIFTFNLPNFNNPWAAMILWFMAGLPMTICMLCVTLRLVSAAKPFGG